jgi:rare lipoprotein A
VNRRGSSHAVVVLVVIAGLLAVPAMSWAGSGGSGLGPSGGTSASSTSQSQSSAGVQSGNVPVSASGGGMTIQTVASALLRNQLQFSGNVPASDAGDVVQIERMGHQTGWTWTVTAETRVAQNGSFSATWHTNHIGRFSVRAVIATSSARAAGSTPTVTVTVYRPSLATQYGPGFYGHRTACGQILRQKTIGVANRTLPCGTPVAVYYKGRTIIVPVIDRGPYANNADWDLTEATGRALGIGGTVTLGAVSLPARQG